jgi:PAS domain S-box-containing protein
MGMPLKVKGVTIGILGVDSVTRYSYDEAVGETVQAFANQAAVAIENARLYRETQERANELAILHQVALATSAVVEADDLLEQTTKMIVRRLSYPCFGFLQFDAEMRELAAHPSFYGLQISSDRLRIALPGSDVESEIRMSEPRIIRQISRNDPLSDLLKFEPEMQAMITVPVQVQLQVYSVLCVLSPQKDAFGSNDVRFLTTLAGLVAAAIERAQLYNTLQNDAARLSALVDQQTAQLRQERDRTQAILDNAGEGIFFVSPDGRIQYANPAAMSLTGYAAPESIGLPLWDWFGDALPEDVRQGIRDLVSAGKSWSGEVTGRRKSGENYDAQVTLAPISGSGERLTGFVGVLSDITRLRDIDRLRAEIIANLSHELRTPLTNINTYIALLERGRPESRERHLRVLRLEAERLARLIDDLLDFSHQQERAPRFRLVELALLVEQTVSAFQAQAEEKGVELQLLPANDRLLVSGDAHQLGQVLSNLIDNAITYTPSGGNVTISCETALRAGKAEAVVRIADSGIGIAQKDLPFIFERFYRGRAAQDANIPGTGLGLAITQEIVQNHGGIVEVGSTLGAGATFVIRLPLMSELESPAEELVKTVG